MTRYACILALSSCILAYDFGRVPANLCAQCDCLGSNMTCIGMIEPESLEPIPAWVRELYIWECSVNRLSRSSFEAVAPHLAKLQVVEADLQQIDPDAFQGMLKLRFLDLSRNPTRMGINPRIFHDLISLKYLNLSRIHHLDDFAILGRKWFPPEVQLEEINLSHTYVRRLSEDITLPPSKRLIFKDLPIQYIHGNRLLLLDSHYSAEIDPAKTEQLDVNGCGPIIDEQFFERFSHLRSLSASQATMNHSVLGVLGKTWDRLEHLNFSWIHLHGLPDGELIWRDVPSQIRVLDLSHNQIQGFSIAKKLNRLQHLDLSSNRLEHFESLRFTPNLVQLRLDDNSLTQLPYDATTSLALSQLETLSLVNNRISLLVPETLATFPHLVSLNLRGNTLRYLNHQLFRLLPLLNNLDLTGNALETFTFTPDIALHNLQLARNNIDQIDAVENCCPNLEILSLEGNVNLFKPQSSSKEMPLCHGKSACGRRRKKLEVLEGLRAVKILDLSQTSLDMLPSHLIRSMPYLQYLSLANNDISDIGLGEGLIQYNLTDVRIQFLNLSANRLTTFSERTQDILMLPWVAELDFSNNDYICSCQLAKAFDRFRYKLLRYFGFDGTGGRLYDCFSEDDSWTYTLREFMFLRRIRESCLPDYSRSRAEANSSLVVYVLLVICFTSVVISLCYIGLARRRRRHKAKDTYTSVDYVILDSRPDQPDCGHHGNAISL